MKDTATARSAGVDSPPARPASPEGETVQRLFKSYCDQIESFCLRQLGSREDAEDATQLTFLRAYRGLSRGASPEFESAWLFKIAHNVCLNSRRSSFRRRRVETPSDLDTLESTALPEQPAAEELLGLTDVLRSLPESQRHAILLREWQGLSYREIGAELELSQSAVEALLFRARRAVAAGLAERRTEPAEGGGTLRASTDAGSLVAALKSLAFGTVAKLVSGMATIAATSAVVTSPHLQTTLSHDLSALTGSQAGGTGHTSTSPARHAMAAARAISGPAHATGATQPTPRSTSRERPTARPVSTAIRPAPPSTLPPESVRRPIGADESSPGAESTRTGQTAPGPTSTAKHHAPPPVGPVASAPDRAPPASGAHAPASDFAGPPRHGGMPPRAESHAGTAADTKPSGSVPARAGAQEIIPVPAGAAPPPTGTTPVPGSVGVPDTSARVTASALARATPSSGDDEKIPKEDVQSPSVGVANGDPPAAAGRSARAQAAAEVAAEAAAGTRADAGNNAPPSWSAAAGNPPGNAGDQPADPATQTGQTATGPVDAAGNSGGDSSVGSAGGSDPGIADGSGQSGDGSPAGNTGNTGNGNAANGNTNADPGDGAGQPADTGQPSQAGGAPNSAASPESSSAGKPKDVSGRGAGHR